MSSSCRIRENCSLQAFAAEICLCWSQYDYQNIRGTLSSLATPPVSYSSFPTRFSIVLDSEKWDKIKEWMNILNNFQLVRLESWDATLFLWVASYAKSQKRPPWLWRLLIGMSRVTESNPCSSLLWISSDYLTLEASHFL